MSRLQLSPFATTLFAISTVLCIALYRIDASAGGLKGGGHFGGGGGRAGGFGGGGMARPSMGGGSMSRPNISRPSMPSPAFGGGGAASRPNISRPSVSMPSVQRPSISVPSNPRPSISRPSGNTPSFGSGLNRPGGNFGGGNLGNGSAGSNLKPGTRPSPLPGNTPGITRPGNQLPTTRPGGGLAGGNRPDLSRPGAGINRPDFSRPGMGTRPSPGDVGDFLGMNKPLRPSPLPGNVTRPGGSATRPDRPAIDRPNNNLPGITRPGIDTRPNINNRPINVGNVNVGNTLINKRPTWVTMDKNQYLNVNNRWQNQIGGIHNWPTTHPGRIDYWRGWGNDVRHHWNHNGNWFRPNWWNGHPHCWGGWHYGYYYHNRPWNYWWSVPAFTSFATWFTWQAPPTVWTEPIYYDYGQGGNVTYNNNVVYINDQPVAKADEFAQSAAVLATVAPPTDDAQAQAAEWMALGTFALATDKKDVDPTRVMQLAVDKEGVISGTMVNTTNDEALAIQGRVDKDTQRVAFRVGDAEQVVCETGLYNLTQSEAPLLVHYGTDRVENYLLVRLDQPADNDP